MQNSITGQLQCGAADGQIQIIPVSQILQFHIIHNVLEFFQIVPLDQIPLTVRNLLVVLITQERQIQNAVFLRAMQINRRLDGYLGSILLLCLIGIEVGQRIVLDVKGIAIFNAAFGTGHKELAVFSEGTLFTVGHVHQIVSALNGHNVPHVGAVRITGNLEAFHIPVKFRQFAQILEGLGITFTDHVCLFVIIKDIDQLPGIPIAAVVVLIRCFGIIRNQAADFLFEGRQLLIVSFVLVLFGYLLGIGSRSLHSGQFRGGGVLVTSLIARCYSHGNLQGSHINHLSIGNYTTPDIHTVSLIKPVKVVRAVHQQCIHNPVHFCLICSLDRSRSLLCETVTIDKDVHAQLFLRPGKLLGFLLHIDFNHCGMALSCCDRFNTCLQNIVHIFRSIGRQTVFTGSAQHNRQVVQELILNIDREHFIIVKVLTEVRNHRSSGLAADSRCRLLSRSLLPAGNRYGIFNRLFRFFCSRRFHGFLSGFRGSLGFFCCRRFRLLYRRLRFLLRRLCHLRSRFRLLSRSLCFLCRHCRLGADHRGVLCIRSQGNGGQIGHQHCKHQQQRQYALHLFHTFSSLSCEVNYPFQGFCTHFLRTAI